MGRGHPLFGSSGEYVQAAGPEPAVGVKPTEPVDYSQTRAWVYPNEVFTSFEAATILHSYYQSWTMPEGYVRRPKMIWPADDPAALGVDLPGGVTEENRPVKGSGSALTREDRSRFEDVPD